MFNKKPNGKDFSNRQILDFFNNTNGWRLGWVESYYTRFDKTNAEFYRIVIDRKSTY